MDQNIDFSGLDQIQTPQYHVIHPPSQEISEEVFHAKGDLMKYIQTFLEEFNYTPFGEKPKILLQAWDKIFAIRHAQPEDSNELFQKLLEDLHIINKEMTECNHPTFFDDNEDHSIQYKEYLENSSKEIAASNSNQEKERPPQDSDIRQLITEECCTKDCREQRQNMKNTMLELVEVCRQKELYFKNVIEQPTERRTRIKESLKNFRVIHKNSISLNNTSQISPVHAIVPILSTKVPEYSLSMGYKHLNTTPETESDEIIKSGDEELVPIPNECEVTKIRGKIFSLEEENDVYQEEEEVDLEDIFQIQDVILREKLLSINRLIANIESLNENHTLDYVLKSASSFSIFEESDNSISENFSPEFETFSDQTKETRSGFTTTHDSLPEYDSFCFEIEPDQERLTSVVMNDIFDDSLNDLLLEKVDLFLTSENSIPPGIENFSYDSEGDIHFLEELLIDDSTPFPENESFDFEDDPLFP
uniref:Reverse transcriptase domain-containing protein n=1 Tax=Tanacetum cinerariifolium TaxID=118510 RepID=A0A6L2K6G6_TANCI|nr:hypothetical protein [Tanacetum cinerariifolium]